MRYYPVFIDLEGQRCVVLGGGRFAVEKAEALVQTGASVHVITARPAVALEHLAAAARISLVRRDYLPGDLASARLVVDASENDYINMASWSEAEAAGILINVVDHPERCRFIAPAIVRRDPLVIAISTSGESPFLASALRARLERWLGWEWGTFTLLVGAVRKRLRSRGVPIAEQTKVYRRLMRSNVLELLRACQCEEAAARTAFLARTDIGHPGRVALVGAGPGDPGLITVRGRELLADADFVLHDALISKDTLALCGPEARLEPVGKRGGAESVNQEDITRRLIELARQGHFVVRLKGGDPFVFGRGGEELRGLTSAGINVVVVPGVSSALAAPASIGIPVTMRGIASSVAIATARGGAGAHGLADLARYADTLVVLMARTGLDELAAELSAALGGGRPAAIVSNATLPNQRFVSARLDAIACAAEEAGIETPATLIVGDVVAAIATLPTLSQVI